MCRSKDRPVFLSVPKFSSFYWTKSNSESCLTYILDHEATEYHWPQCRNLDHNLMSNPSNLHHDKKSFVVGLGIYNGKLPHGFRNSINICPLDSKCWKPTWIAKIFWLVCVSTLYRRCCIRIWCNAYSKHHFVIIIYFFNYYVIQVHFQVRKKTLSASRISQGYLPDHLYFTIPAWYN